MEESNQSENALISIFKTIDSIKSAIELGNSVNLAADVAKLVAHLAASTATSTTVLTYGALKGLGRSLALWHLGRRVSGNETDIAKSADLAGFVAGKLVGHGIDVVRDWELGGKLYDWTHPDLLINTTYRTAAATRPAPIYRDPLAIDLDGDGIETVGINANGQVVTFDHDADGVRTGSGWVSGDDAWLVFDRNGNGSIDSGRALFGVDSRAGAAADGRTGWVRDLREAMSLGTEQAQALITRVQAFAAGSTKAQSPLLDSKRSTAANGDLYLCFA